MVGTTPPPPQSPQHIHWSPCLQCWSLSIHRGTNGLPESGTSPPLLMKSQILHLPSLNSAPALTSSTGLSHTRWRPQLGTWNSLPPSLSLWKQLPALSNIAQESCPSRGLLRTPPPLGAPEDQCPFLLLGPQALGKVIPGGKAHVQKSFFW